MIGYYFIFLISGFPSVKHQSFIKKTERSDTTILGTLDICHLCLWFQLPRRRLLLPSSIVILLQPQLRTIRFAKKTVGAKNQDQQNDRIGDQVPKCRGEDHGDKHLDKTQ